MEYVKLGKTGLKVSRMGLGGIPIQRRDEKGTQDIIDALTCEGINYIDSARAYSVSEELIGKAIKGRRERFVLATKSMAITKQDMAEDIKTSLHNLCTEYIDIYQLHNPSMEKLKAITGEGGALGALKEAKHRGSIGHIGLTAHSLEVFSYAMELPWVETIMFPYNIVEKQGEQLIDMCAKRGIGFIAMKPLAGGAIDDYRLALRFIDSNKGVDIYIPGMASSKEVHDNVQAIVDKQPLTNEEMKRLEEIVKELGNSFCRRCNYCAPCTVGINIPAVFLALGYLERYGLREWGRERYMASPAKASQCIQCGTCENRCPYNLPIRHMLKRCVEAFDKLQL